MKYLISESKINKVILDYINDEFTPNFNNHWGHDAHKNYFVDFVEKYGSFGFDINTAMFAYYGEYDGYDYLYKLIVDPSVSNKLTPLFGDLWKPIFVKWFEDNTGLKVKEFLTDED